MLEVAASPSDIRILSRIAPATPKRAPWACCRARQVALRYVPRFNVACQNLSAAAPQTTAIDADTLITAMFMSVRSPSASAIHMTPIRGNGAAASIRDQSRANISPTPPRPSPRPEPISSEHGRCSCRNAPRPIFRRGAIREIGPRENMRCGMLASGLSRPAMDPASRAVVL